MTVHAIVPVFNRLALTQQIVECLRHQVVSEPLQILLINDGSTDGTSEWLASQSDIEVLEGDGSLFWGGAVDLALGHLDGRTAHKDWVLLINNDITVAENFVQRLLDIAKAYAPAAVGSVIRDENQPERLLSLGPKIDAWRLLVTDLLNFEETRSNDVIIAADALSGRGVLFPLDSLLIAGGMRPRTVPHYMADYEISLRVRKSGYRLLISTTAAVYSEDDYGSMRSSNAWRDRFFSIRSPLYLPALVVFWWEASNWRQRLTLPLRLVLFALFPRLRKTA